MTASSDGAGPRPGMSFIIMLGMTVAISPLSMSAHIQSIPAIADDLSTSYASVQLTISVFLVVFAFAQLFVGPLSDRLGRRPVLFGGLGIFAAASLLAAFAPTIEVMILARALQAAGGCASLVTPRAVVQDRYSGIDAARVMAFVAILQSTSPIIGPIIGGGIDLLFGWRAIFGFLALYALIIGTITGLRLPESRPTDGGQVASWSTIFSRYLTLLGSRRYICYTAIYTLGTTGYFGFLATGPAVMIGDLGLQPWQFSMVLATISIQFVLGGYTASRLVTHLGIDRVLLVGAVIQIFAVTAFWVISRDPTAIGSTAAMCLYAFSNGLIFSTSLTGATSVDPRIAGSAASILGSTQFGLGGVIALSLAELPTANFGPYPLVLITLAVGTLISVIVVLKSRHD